MVYPNPSTGQVQVQPPMDGQVRLQAFDVQGKLVHDKLTYVAAANPIMIDFPVKGMYKLRLYYTDRNAEAYTGTVVIQ